MKHDSESNIWVLSMIVTVLGAPPTVARLESYKTLKDCEDERIRIMADLNSVYFGDERNYTLECKPAKKPM